MPLPLTFTYRGYDALLRPPEPFFGDREGLAVPSFDVGSAGGWFTAAVDAKRVAARRVDLTYILTSRAEITQVRAFLAAREGRRVPFWCPTFTYDAEVAVGTQDGFTFRAWGYPDLFAAHGGAHRHWLAYGPGAATYRWWRIGTATDNGNGTETVGRASGVTTDGTAPSSGLTSAAGYRYHLFQFARLAEDTVPIEYLGAQLARVVVPVVTIPQETP